MFTWQSLQITSNIPNNTETQANFLHNTRLIPTSNLNPATKKIRTAQNQYEQHTQ